VIDNGYPRTKTEERYCYGLPSIHECRADFEKILRQPVDWTPRDDDDEPGPADY
jgi:hypothetical protein